MILIIFLLLVLIYFPLIIYDICRKYNRNAIWWVLAYIFIIAIFIAFVVEQNKHGFKSKVRRKFDERRNNFIDDVIETRKL